MISYSAISYDNFKFPPLHPADGLQTLHWSKFSKYIWECAWFSTPKNNPEYMLHTGQWHNVVGSYTVFAGDTAFYQRPALYSKIRYLYKSYDAVYYTEGR